MPGTGFATFLLDVINFTLLIFENRPIILMVQWFLETPQAIVFILEGFIGNNNVEEKEKNSFMVKIHETLRYKAALKLV